MAACLSRWVRFQYIIDSKITKIDDFLLLWFWSFYKKKTWRNLGLRKWELLRNDINSGENQSDDSLCLLMYAFKNFLPITCIR